MTPLLSYSDVWLMGGGGKTTLMYKMARAWATQGKSVICTTTTRIFPPSKDQCPDIRYGDVAAVTGSVHDRPTPLVTLARGIESGKCVGYTADEVGALTVLADHVVVEADGAAGRPLKAHASYEPVISRTASCVVAVVGGWSVGRPLNEDHVHRPDRFAELSGLAPGETVTAASVADVILHDEGWGSAVPSTADFFVLVTGADSGIGDALSGHVNAARLTGIL